MVNFGVCFRRRKTFLLPCLIFFIILISAKAYIYHTIVNIAYVTRPVWDTPQKPWNVITHYYSPHLPWSDLCHLHGWRMNRGAPKVYDAVLFSVELDLLEIRIRELFDVVEKFIIIEANSTFTGLPKPLVFAENRNRFDFAKHKIIYKTVEVPVLPANGDPFDVERAHRLAMNSLIQNSGIQKDDWVLMMDVDEIPSWHTVELLRRCDGIPPILHLQLRNYLYSFEFQLDMESWRGKASKYPAYYGHARSSDDILADSGWHCSFCFKHISDFVFKMQGYSHADRVHSQYFLDPKRIQNVICDGVDIFDMPPEAWDYRELVRKWGPMAKETSMIVLPRLLLEHPQRFKFLLPGGCVRES
ncbi:glycosyl transferase [Globomyces pollinis-pini]|nr:glycosyl transferase [Globomyces pollinis-pini]